jgi:hypothetical protein
MKTFLLALFWFISCFGFSQSGTAQLKGTILDAKTGEKIPFAYLTISQNNKIKGSAQSDGDGNYSINSFQNGNYIAKVKMVGYKDFEKKIKTRADFITILDIELIPKDVQLNEFIVEAKKYEQRIAYETVSMTVIENTLIK